MKERVRIFLGLLQGIEGGPQTRNKDSKVKEGHFS
jgi:hypothetical protein